MELVLAGAKLQGCREIITAGGLGSHHILAAAALGGRQGFRVIGLFFCQPVTERVKKNLLLEKKFGTEMHFVRDYPGLAGGYLRFYLREKLSGNKPLLLMPGGSNPLTTIGYINCMVEIQDQLETMALAEPEAVFAAAGTGGTAAGLLAGLALGGSGTSLHAVRVVQPAILRAKRISGLASGALARLAGYEPGINAAPASVLGRKLYLEDNYLGGGYGFFSEKAGEAAKMFRDLEGIELEECYTAKAAAALIDYCRRTGSGKNRRPVVFVHTAASTGHIDAAQLPKPAELPAEFQWCFSDEPRNCRCTLRRQNYSFCTAVRTAGWSWPC